MSDGRVVIDSIFNDKPVQEGLKNLQNTMQKTGKEMGKVGKNLSKKVTAPIVAMGTAAIKIGMDFEQSMSKVKAMSGATSEEMVLLEKAARDAGASTSKSAKDAADALGYMALAGWDSKTSMDALMPILRLSEAGNIDLAKASSLVTDSMSAMGIQVQDLPRYLDIVAQTARSSNTDIDQMAEAYLKVGGTLRGLNVPLEESALALGFLANAGIKGSEAGTALNAVMTNLTAPTGRAKQALEELGFSAFDSEGNFKGLENVLFDLQGKLAGMTKEQRNTYLAMIGGKEHVKDLNALLNGLDDSYDNLTASIKESDGALEDVAKTMQENNKGSLTELMSAIEELGLKIYDILKPAIANIIDAIQGFIDKLNALSPAQQEMIVKIALLVAAIGPALVIIGKLITIVSGAISVFGKLIPIIKLCGTVIGAINAPIAIAIAAVAALIAIGVSLWKNWEEITAFARRLGENLGNIFNNIKDSISNSISNAKTKVTQEFTNLANNSLKAVRNLPSQMMSIGKDIAMGMAKGIKNAASSAINAAKDLASSVSSRVKSTLRISSPSKVIIDMGEDTGEGFEIGISNKIKAISDKAREIADVSMPSINPTMAMAGGGTINHSGTIRIEGVNDQGQFINAVEIVLEGIKNPSVQRAVSRTLYGNSESRTRGLGGKG